MIKRYKKNIDKARNKNKIIKMLIFMSLTVCLLLLHQIIFRQKSSSLNVVIISIDTMRSDHMGVYGYNKNTTPNIDSFSKNATVFTNASTVVPMTHGSFTALMTGFDMFKTRVVSNRDQEISFQSKTLASRLKANGYKTAAFVSNEPTLYQGFDQFLLHPFKGYFLDENLNEKFYQKERGAYESFINFSSQWIVNHKKEKFFTWIHLMDVHAPYFPPPDLRCKFNNKYCAEISNKNLDDLERLRVEYQMCQNNTVPRNRIELMKTLYDGGVAAADRLVGHIIDTLKKEGLYKNTIVIIYGDHGEGFDHNYYFNHREVLYQSAVNIPLIIYHPLFLQKKIRKALLQNTDILPTLLDLLNIPYDDNFSGKSFAYLFNPNPFVRKFTYPTRTYSYYSNSGWNKFAISDGKYKYIISFNGSCMLNNQQEELYDLFSDQQEKYNIVNKNKKEKNILRTLLLKKLGEYNLPQARGSMNGTSGYVLNQKQESQVDTLRSLQY